MAKFTFIQIATAKLIQDYEVVSEYDAKRLEVAKDLLQRDAKRYLAGLNVNSGLYGQVFELLSRKPNSTVTWVQSSNKSDYITRINGTTTHVEVKTNFGRVGEYYKSSHNNTKYIVYAMCCEKVSKHVKKDGSTDVKRWIIEPIIMRMNDFLDILERTNATKYIEHKNLVTSDRELAIKPWYNPFYEALKAYNATPYNRLGNYKSSDIK